MQALRGRVMATQCMQSCVRLKPLSSWGEKQHTQIKWQVSQNAPLMTQITRTLADWPAAHPPQDAHTRLLPCVVFSEP